MKKQQKKEAQQKEKHIKTLPFLKWPLTQQKSVKIQTFNRSKRFLYSFDLDVRSSVRKREQHKKDTFPCLFLSRSRLDLKHADCIPF